MAVLRAASAFAILVLVGVGTPAIAKTQSGCGGAVKGNLRPGGVVPDQRTALELARTYLTTAYGAEQIKSQLPLKADVRGGVWYVHGSLKPGWKGGVAEIELCQRDGRVLSLIHGK